MDIDKRARTAFLLIPWFPIFFLVPYFYLIGTAKLETPTLEATAMYFAFGFFIALLTYLLEFIFVVPIWKSSHKAGKTSLTRFAVTGFSMGVVFSFIVSSILTGPATLLEPMRLAYVLLFGAIGVSEAVFFWFYVRPDKHSPKKHAPQT